MATLGLHRLPMVSTLAYDNYRLYLRDALKEWTQGGSARSLRSFCMHSGVSPSYLSRVLSGQRNLTAEYANRIQRFLKLPLDESIHLFDLIELDNAPTSETRIRALKAIAARRAPAGRILDIEQFKAVADWYHFAILSLVGTKGFKADVPWIAKRLGIDRTETKAALDRLLSLNLLRWRGKKLELSAGSQIQTPHDVASAAARENHRQHLSKAAGALDELDVELREFVNRTLNMNLKNIPEAKRRIRRFIDQFNNDMEQPAGEDVYQINIQFYRLSKSDKGRA